MKPLSLQLLQAYRETCYRVSFPEGMNRKIFVGHAHPELDELVREMLRRDTGFQSRSPRADWDIVTACNPRSIPASDAENRAAQIRLLAELHANHRVKTIDAEGTLGDWREPSVFILGLELEDAFALGKRYGQNAILHGRLGQTARLIDCTGVVPLDVTEPNGNVFNRVENDDD